jgi:TolB-like protein/Tfp pilus assembly protein PilF
MSFIAELKRRNVPRVAAAYLVGAWLLVQVSATLFPVFGFGHASVRITVILIAIGFVPVLVFAWAFEITPEGLKRGSAVDRSPSRTARTGKMLDRIIMVILALALAYFAFDKFVLSQSREAAIAESARKAGRTEALVQSYGEKSIAVLPFVDMSPNKDQEYFSDGIAEELLNLLTKIPQLRVTSRSSSFSYKGKDVRLAQVAEELNVAHILEGSVRKTGNKVRITAQLIEARSDTHLWSQTYDRPLDDIFAVQDEIAGAVVGQLKIRLLGAAPKAKEVDPQAYALYLQALQVYRQNTPEAWEQSVTLLQQALALDPGYAAALSGLAAIYVNQVDQGLRPRDDGLRSAREALVSALESDSGYAPAHSRLGRIATTYDGDLGAAARHFEHALALEPANTEIIGSAAGLIMTLGRLDTGIALREYVTARDPADPITHFNLGYAYLSAGRPDEAIASSRSALRLSPDYVSAHFLIGAAMLQQGEAQDALLEMQQETSEAWRQLGLTIVYHALGRHAESDAVLAETIANYSSYAAYNIASVLAWRNEPDRAFEWLDKAVTQQDMGLSEITYEPMFDNLRNDPRWLPFLRRLGKAPDQLAAIRFDVALPQ